MLYLVDASAVITAHNTYLALHRVPEFWSWLLHHGNEGSIKLPQEIYAEVCDGNDHLAEWMKTPATKQALRLDEDADPVHVQMVLGHYGAALTEADLVTIGKDAFLVAAALVTPDDRCVVTAEVSKPTRTGARRHVPNVCDDCAVQWINPVRLLQALDFSTSWNLLT